MTKQSDQKAILTLYFRVKITGRSLISLPDGLGWRCEFQGEQDERTTRSHRHHSSDDKMSAARACGLFEPTRGTTQGGVLLAIAGGTGARREPVLVMW